MSRTGGWPDRRDQAELLAEELRRLDPDDVYAESLEWLFNDQRRRVRRRVHAGRPSTAQIAKNEAAERPRPATPRTSPPPGTSRAPQDAESAATGSMNADEGETGVEAEQEIQQS